MNARRPNTVHGTKLTPTVPPYSAEANNRSILLDTENDKCGGSSLEQKSGAVVIIYASATPIPRRLPMWNAENGNKCATDGPCSKPQRNRTQVVMREAAQNESITQ